MFICLVSVHTGLACARSRSSRQDLRAALMIRRRRNNYSSSARVTMTMTTTTSTRLRFYMYIYISFRVIIYLYRRSDSRTRWSDADCRCDARIYHAFAVHVSFLCLYLDVDDRLTSRFFSNNNGTL